MKSPICRGLRSKSLLKVKKNDEIFYFQKLTSNFSASLRHPFKNKYNKINHKDKSRNNSDN